jgi:hypothetical protein
MRIGRVIPRQIVANNQGFVKRPGNGYLQRRVFLATQLWIRAAAHVRQ